MDKITKVIILNICFLAGQTLTLPSAEVEELHNERGCVLRVGRVGFSNNTKALDTSGHENDGVLNGNTIAWSYSKSAYAINEDGNRNNCLIIGTVDALDYANTFDSIDKTITAWIWLDTASVTTWYNPVFFCSDSDGSPRIRCFAYMNGRSDMLFNIQGDGGANSTALSSGNEATTGIWHFVICERDVSENKSTIYLDNKEIASDTTDVGTISQFTSDDYPRIGAPTHPAIDHSFDGFIGEVKWYNRLLTATEKHKSYLQGKDKHK